MTVKAKGGGNNHVLIAYALLNNRSIALFSTDDLLKKLAIQKEKYRTSLTRINGVQDRFDSTVVNVESMYINENTFSEVPNAFSIKSLDISGNAITRKGDIYPVRRRLITDLDLLKKYPSCIGLCTEGSFYLLM